MKNDALALIPELKRTILNQGEVSSLDDHDFLEKYFVPLFVEAITSNNAELINKMSAFAENAIVSKDHNIAGIAEFSILRPMCSYFTDDILIPLMGHQSRDMLYNVRRTIYWRTGMPKEILNSKEERKEFEWRWCLVGNIVESHPYGEQKETRYGTKIFNPGAKVYVAPSNWGDGGERRIVIGRARKTHLYVETIIRGEFIHNYRLQKIYSPEVIRLTNKSQYRWWNNTDEDKLEIRQFCIGYAEYEKEIKEMETLNGGY